MKEVLYLVIPCYNEEEVLYETAKRLKEKISMMISKDLISAKSRIMFINDGSRIIRGILSENCIKRMKYLVE